MPRHWVSHIFHIFFKIANLYLFMSNKPQPHSHSHRHSQQFKLENRIIMRKMTASKLKIQTPSHIFQFFILLIFLKFPFFQHKRRSNPTLFSQRRPAHTLLAANDYNMTTTADYNFQANDYNMTTTNDYNSHTGAVCTNPDT